MTHAPEAPTIDMGEIRKRLEDDILQLARALVPDGRRNGDYWIGRNPARADKHGGSFWIRIKEPKGIWKDEATGATGDVIKLVQYAQGLSDYSVTRRWCLRYLGIQPGAPAPTKEEQARLEARRRADEKRRAAEEAAITAKRRKAALGLWLQARPIDTGEGFEGSVLDRYWRGARGLDMRGKPVSGALRFAAEHDYRTADGELIARPCLIAHLTGPDGTCWGIHRTWLEPDGRDKALFPDPKQNKPRKIWPAGWRGAVIRISKGGDNLTPEQAVKRGKACPLIICEGIEDGLTLALALPSHRVWAACTLGNIGLVPIMDCVSEIIVAADNDWNKPEAQRALAQGLEQLRASGRPVRVARSPRGKDFNDLVKGE
ncbi:hypothetical protein NA8A_04763 [Nitratireductor indicus C115]|uniref:Uncharacterized protein n=1 Tax=Nitratireductor indicus C115 TaxID=1231190 RepID=K2NZG1_9HYPH|nr:toprim domain-containing protein [Nitratireductor indicus]EKF43314.1 hypothetical protein NA8A_04763 [Nitratireductor indicus C115]SFQ10269.1 Toprim domain-containing protein [Nitratireductor indicus]